MNNQEIQNTQVLIKLISKLSVGKSLGLPSYEDLYPEHWANDNEVEDRHKEIIRKIQRWPTDEKNEVSRQKTFKDIKIFIPV